MLLTRLDGHRMCFKELLSETGIVSVKTIIKQNSIFVIVQVARAMKFSPQVSHHTLLRDTQTAGGNDG